MKECAPDEDSRLVGEVVENTILIYECDERKAVEILKHEFINYIVSRAIDPYKESGIC